MGDAGAAEQQKTFPPPSFLFWGFFFGVVFPWQHVFSALPFMFAREYPPQGICELRPALTLFPFCGRVRLDGAANRRPIARLRPFALVLVGFPRIPLCVYSRSPLYEARLLLGHLFRHRGLLV